MTIAELLRQGTPEWERRKRVFEAAVPKMDDPDRCGLSDDDLAALFTKKHGNSLRYVAAWGAWLHWTGTHYERDERLTTFDLVRHLCRAARDDAFNEPTLTESQRKSLRQRLGSTQTIWNVAKLASSDTVHAVTPAQLDAHAWHLNTRGGIVDLKTAAILPHNPAELHTKVTAAAPGGDCPIWLAHLERVLPDAEVRSYLQRLFGSALVGAVIDHVLPFFYGNGRNGKGVTVHAIRAALGDYGLEIPAETLMESHNERHPTELAVLRGARLVVGSEVDTGRKWNESRLKRLTGGDPISARFIGRDLFEFNPSHTLVIVGNAKPGLRSVDEAIRGRFHLVPFDVTIPVEERDGQLPSRLAAEYGGILQWMIDGCVEWQRIGLAPPASVLSATENYLQAEDSIESWDKDCLATGGQLTLKAAHASYRKWCDENAATPLGRNTFKDQLLHRGYQVARSKTTNTDVIAGIQLKATTDNDHWSAQ